jgi:AcrR family transcriptional regulator
VQKAILTYDGEYGTKTQDSGSLRERKHEFVLREIEQAAWDLFATVGYDRATVEEISRRAGVSRRTFFRYFRSKEDLLSFSLEHCGQRIAQKFAEAPKSRDPLVALEDAMLAVMKEEMADTSQSQTREMLGLMFEEPDVRGRFLCALNSWIPILSKELVKRKAYKGNAARCDLAAALYCTAFDQAHLCWLHEPGIDLATQIKRAFRQLRETKQRRSAQ